MPLNNKSSHRIVCIWNIFHILVQLILSYWIHVDTYKYSTCFILPTRRSVHHVQGTMWVNFIIQRNIRQFIHMMLQKSTSIDSTWPYMGMEDSREDTTIRINFASVFDYTLWQCTIGLVCTGTEWDQTQKSASKLSNNDKTKWQWWTISIGQYWCTTVKATSQVVWHTRNAGFEQILLREVF